MEMITVMRAILVTISKLANLNFKGKTSIKTAVDRSFYIDLIYSIKFWSVF